MTDFLPDYMLFAIGLGLLLGGAEMLVRYATKVASLIGKSTMFMGLTVTAFGTSAPELAVGISGKLSQSSDVGLGNIIGSNIFNIFVVLGIAAVLNPIIVRRPVVWRDIPILLVVSVFFFLFALNGNIGSFESIVLASALAVYLYYHSRKSTERPDVSTRASHNSEDAGVSIGLPVSLIMIVASIAVIGGGSHLVVTGAVSIAGSLGIGKLVTGLTIVAVGTSLPEIATTIAAIRNNEHELAIGNVIGSCFFNIVAVPAAMSLIGTAGLSIGDDALAIDIPVMILAVLACLPIFFSGHRISRAEGVLFLVYYGAYSMVLYTRNTSGSLLNRYQTEMGFLALAVVSVTFVVIVFRATRYHRHHRKEIGS